MRRSLAKHLLLFHNLSAVLAQLQSLDFYTDLQCQTASTEHAEASIPLSECIVTPGLGSVSINPIGCTSGSVNLISYSDTSCGTQLGSLDLEKVTNTCSGRYSGDIAAISLTCNQESDEGTIDPGTLTTTSTITVGQVAGSAQTSSPAGTTSGAATATQTASSNTSSNSNSDGDGGTSNSAVGSSTSSLSGLSTSDIISIAVGLGVGIPSIIIGLWQLQRLRRNRANRGMEMGRETSQNTYFDPNSYSNQYLRPGPGPHPFSYQGSSPSSHTFSNQNINHIHVTR
ncbi:hypothetical protein MMC12_006596 [Toensbergia leucococca]|nr:hypothetical protein [Toensbergia leucococca]